ncbi:MAG: mechanosensitive ion channel family protein [Nocardioides sp.]
MSLLQTEPTCAPEDWLCTFVDEETGNAWLAKASDWLVATPFQLLVLLLIALTVRWFLHRTIDRVTRRAAEGLPTPMLKHKPASAQKKTAAAVVAGRRVQRAQTMGSLMKSIASIAIFSIAGITAMAELGFPVGPLIASAGIVGVALGFGAQSLVTDFLSGIFMIVEDQYGVGDVIDLGEASGTVEAVGLRVTRLRDVEGTVWYVRNGEVVRVGNSSQNWARTVVDVPLGHDQDLYKVQDILRDIAHSVWEDEDFKSLIIEEPEVWGVQDLTPDWITVRVTMKTAPLEQWAVAREMRERIKARFDHEGIELARPTRVTIMRNETEHAASSLPSSNDRQTHEEGPDMTGAPDESGAPVKR